MCADGLMGTETEEESGYKATIEDLNKVERNIEFYHVYPNLPNLPILQSCNMAKHERLSLLYSLKYRKYKYKQTK